MLEPLGVSTLVFVHVQVAEHDPSNLELRGGFDHSASRPVVGVHPSSVAFEAASVGGGPGVVYGTASVAARLGCCTGLYLSAHAFCHTATQSMSTSAVAVSGAPLSVLSDEAVWITAMNEAAVVATSVPV
jgi:hypothetical protein